MKKATCLCKSLFSMKRADQRMKKEAAFGHAECGKRREGRCALRFIFNGGASSCFMFVAANASLRVSSLRFFVDIRKSLRQERLFLLLFGSFDTMFNSEGGEYDSEYVYDGFHSCLFSGNDL